jgi:hypothetical protein
VKAFSTPSLIQVVDRTRPVAIGLVSSTGGARLPFTAGMAFRKGEMPSGVVAEIPSQWTTKNRWSDGSVKIGQISGLVDLQPGIVRSIPLSNGTGGGAPLTIENLKATKVSARIAVAGHGAADWSASDWDAPYEQWVSGPLMSSWLYFKRLDKTWLTAWIEVRLYANGQVAVLPSLENGYVRAPGRGLQQGRVTFSLNGDARYDSVRTAWIYDHARYILAENADGWHWTGSPPGVFAKLDTRYLMSTGLVPHYPFSAPQDSIFTRYQQKIIPFTFVDQKRRPEAAKEEEFHGAANMPNPWRPTKEGWKLRGGIGAAGYHDSIGVLPRWDAMYLTSGGESAVRAMLANHAACGLGYYHMRRDNLSGDIHRWSDYPRMGYGGSAADMYSPPKNEEAFYGWSITHMPQVGFLPYLVTGAKYWCDETIMLGVFVGQTLAPTWRAGVATGNLLTDQNAQKMIVWDDSAYQPRGAAWAHRAIACAACAAPDGHPNKQPFVNSMANTATFILDACVRGTTHLSSKFVNALGILPQSHHVNTPYGNVAMDSWVAPAWMYAFWIAAIGYGWDLCEDSFTSDQRAEYLSARNYAYKWPVGLAGTYPGGWCWRAAGTASIGITNHLYLPSTTHPETRFFESFEEMWKENVKRKIANDGKRTDPNYERYGMIDCAPGGSLFSYTYVGWVADTSYWANYLPSIAYAVTHDAPGAREAWARLMTASNVAEIMSDSSTYRNNPVWGIRPR